MTTIAGNAHMLVADSQCSDSDQKWRVVKVERIDGGLYATAGGASDGEKFYAWVRRGKRGKRPVVDDEFSALVLVKEGLFLFDKNLYPMRLTEDHAIGSGGKACRAAMLAGADICRAVAIVCEVDAGSSLPIQVYELIEKKE